MLYTRYAQPIILSVSFSCSITITLENGYKLNTSLDKRRISISKSDKENNKVGIEIKNTKINIQEYLEEIRKEHNTLPEFHDGPNGFQYYVSKWWDPNPKTVQIANVSRIFFKETNNDVIEIIQYDYAGGKYDREIDTLISAMEI